MGKLFIVNLFERLFSHLLPPFIVSRAAYLSLLCAQQEVGVCFVRELQQLAKDQAQSQ